MAERKPKRWRDLSGAQRYALVQSQVLMWLGVAVVAYLLAANVSVVVAMVFVVPLVGLFLWMLLRLRRARP